MGSLGETGGFPKSLLKDLWYKSAVAWPLVCKKEGRLWMADSPGNDAASAMFSRPNKAARGLEVKDEGNQSQRTWLCSSFIKMEKLRG